MFRTTSASISAAIERQTAAQCAAGRHVAGCPHHPAVHAPWVRSALAGTLPPKVYR